MDFIQKLIALEQTIARDHGDFVLYTVLHREDAPNRWDLLVAAPWLAADDPAAVDLIGRYLLGTLTPQEMTLLSRIIVFPIDDPRVQEIRQRVDQAVRHGHVEVSQWELAGMPIRHAHVVTST